MTGPILVGVTRSTTDGVPPQPGAELPAPASLSVAAVARRLGVAPATLRTWHRRYGLGPSEHVTGSDRRYASRDLDRLQVMRHLVLEGVAPGEAARAALASPLPGVGSTLPPVDPGAAHHEPTGLAGSLAQVNAAVRGLGVAAAALDAPAMMTLMRGLVQRYGVVDAWDQVLRPVLRAVGQRWAQLGEGIEVEHLLSDCVTVVLREVGLRDAGQREPEQPGAAQPADDQRPVLLACGAGEQHALPLHALSAALAERGILTRMLGPSLPAAALAAAVRRTAPALLLVWSQTPATADCAALLALPSTRQRTALVLAGPGWPLGALPGRLTRAEGLGHALVLVDQALGG